MSSRQVALSGIGKFVKVFNPETYMGNDVYSLALYPDASSLAIFRDLKLKNNVKEDEHGKFITLRRNDKSREFNGKVIFKGGPPVVKDDTGNPWPENTWIGNGSKITVQLEVYQSKFGPGSRILGVRVDELVPYNPQPTEEKEAIPF